MIITTPPAIHAPAMPCTPNEANPADAVGTVPSLYSPDCRWRLDSKITDTDATKCYLSLRFLAMPWRRRIYSYCSDSANVFVHWLSDGRTAVVNNYEGADSAEPFVIGRDGRPGHTAVNLFSIVARDFDRRVNIGRKRFAYHFYVSYEHETPDGIEVSLREDDAGNTGGPVYTRCLIYHFLKPDYRHYRLISQTAPVDMDKASCDGFAADRK